MTGTPAPDAAGHWHLASVPNFRDLGGIRARDGRAVVAGAVFRSGSLRDLTDEDAARLAGGARIAAFYDLRTPEEIGEDDGWRRLAARGVQRTHAAVGGLSPDFVKLARPEWPDYARNYIETLAHAGPALRALFSALAAPRPAPLAFGCSLGKDRTGVVAALLLAALGVDEAAVAEDYAATTCCLARHADRLAWLAREKAITPDELRRRCVASPAAMGPFFATLEREHGGALAYLASVGVTPELVARTRDNLLTAPPP